ncbi:hypothetical protein, variant 3 [Aphanomyces astaci]|uniref:Uncharacterized protein n=2 Tax=Aphanomyces astaci TaxID=112090 RepID=W4FR38_APHAT|nr:hypothetical protein, variant 2 [Aphanomyces astaci]XP_009841137.1 hypothetical protein, variant 3 [Aphanomyces astaci]ETV69279.1 hypothetical protein, variant 2 [Aphanomyces astaci]ETV69280.1 hypothetical protein, variant 3 [Aphanomyces astaci]|eukprot:XP_009841136.1 hypothetical protein, variant 2 [Aphanomyces astaci]
MARRELCSLCQNTYASGVEPATGNEIWLARKMFRERCHGNAAIHQGLQLFSDLLDDPEAIQQMQVVQVCVFCAQFIASNALKDLKKIDDTRHVLLAHSTTRHAHSASLVIQHRAGTSVDADAAILRYLPNEMNRVLTIRPSTTSTATNVVNLKRQQQSELRQYSRVSRALRDTQRDQRRLQATHKLQPSTPSFPMSEYTTAPSSMTSLPFTSPTKPPSAAKHSMIVTKKLAGGRFSKQELVFPTIL